MPTSRLRRSHPYHLVEPSPYPLLSGILAGSTALGATMFMHGYTHGSKVLLLSLGLLLVVLVYWWTSIVKEAKDEGHHTLTVQRGLRLGFALFIVSEVMFFFAFFWSFFHSSLSPTVELGCVWPPRGIPVFSPWGVPLANTLMLLLSGLAITGAHHYLLLGSQGQYDSSVRATTKNFFLYTLFWAVAFTLFQLMEYANRGFSISDGVYGSTFFMATGFHGLHVVIGTIFIAVCFGRYLYNHFTEKRHIGFEARAWYWHFVDVVWLFLFVAVYWWGNAS